MTRASFVGVSFWTALFLRAPSAPAEAKAELGLRTGYGIPIGRYYDRESNTTAAEAEQQDFLEINSDAAGQIPIWFDLGARIGKVYVGGYIAYGIVVFSSEHADDCEAIDDFAQSLGGSASCTFHGLRLGANAHYHFGEPGASFDPWLGGGFGYEWLTQGVFLEAQGREGDVSLTYHGFEFLNVQAGIDVPVSESAGFGPFIAATLASYQTGSGSCTGDACDDETSSSEDLDDTSIHAWVFFGVRGTFRF